MACAFNNKSSLSHTMSSLFNWIINDCIWEQFDSAATKIDLELVNFVKSNLLKSESVLNAKLFIFRYIYIQMNWTINFKCKNHGYTQKTTNFNYVCEYVWFCGDDNWFW
jgi:hypothetical protein